MSTVETFILGMIYGLLPVVILGVAAGAHGARVGRRSHPDRTRYRLRVRYYAGLRKKWGFSVSPIAADPDRELASVASGRRRTRATATLAAHWKARRHARGKRLEARTWSWEVRR